MKKYMFLHVFCFIITRFVSAQELPKNIVGISAGIVPATMDMYFDKPFNIWPDRELSPIYQLFYARQVREAFRIGSYIEYEEAKFSVNPLLGIRSFTRLNIGMNWLGQFPKQPCICS